MRKITTLSPPPRLRGPEGDNLTLNKFIKNFDSKPSISVDLEDFQTFPTFGMYEDIQDVVRMFVGGKQTVQPGSHTQMRGFTTTSTKCNYTICRKLAPTSVWPENKVELFLANVLIIKSLPSLDIQINLQMLLFWKLINYLKIFIFFVYIFYGTFHKKFIIV